MADAVEITCPRCQSLTTSDFYGPCGRCRAELRASLGGVGREVKVAAYEPKANVIPNQVATKE